MLLSGVVAAAWAAIQMNTELWTNTKIKEFVERIIGA